MAVAFNVASNSNGTTSISWSHASTGTAAGAVVWVSHYGATTTDDVTGVTYGGVDMSLVASQAGDANLNGFACIYFLAAPPTGTQDVVVSGGSAAKRTYCITVTSATGNTAVQTYASTGPTSYTRNTTVSANTMSLSGVSCWVASTYLTSNTATGRVAPRTGWTSVVEYDWGSNVTANYRYNTVGTTDVTTGFTGSTDSGTGYFIDQSVAIREAAPPSALSETVTASESVDAAKAHEVLATQSETVTASDSMAAAIPGLIDRANGSSFPITATGTSADPASMVSGSFYADTGQSGVIVVIHTLADSNDNMSVAPVLSWTGGSAPSGCSSFTQRAVAYHATGREYASIWTATFDNGIASSGSPATVTITYDYPNYGPGTNARVLVVDALLNANPAGGASAINQADPASGSVTLTGVTAKSWLYVASSAEGGATTTEVANTDYIIEATTAAMHAWVGLNDSGTSGNIEVGITEENTGHTATAAYEILKAAAAATPKDGTQSESSTASDNLDSEVPGPRLGTLSESVTTDETQAGTVDQPTGAVKQGELSESVTSSDAVSASLKATVSLSETVTTDETQAATRIGPGVGNLVEGTLSETVTTSDSVSSQMRWPAPVIDSGFPKSNWANNANVTTITTPSFDVSGGRVMVAVFSWYPPDSDPWPATVAWVGGTPAGASDWSMVQESYDGTIHWMAGIWWATTSANLTSQQVIATRSNGGNLVTGILSVYALRSAQTTAGAHAEHHSTMAEVGAALMQRYEVDITPTGLNSQIIGISHGGDTYYAFTANSITTIDYQQNDGGSDGGAAAWHKTNPTEAIKLFTVGCSDQERAFAVAAVEVKSAGIANNYTESVTTSDELVATVVHSTAPVEGIQSETSTASDAVDASAKIWGGISESSTTSDSINSGLRATAGQSETVTASESLSVFARFVSTFSETVTADESSVSDRIGASAPKEGTQGETATATDTSATSLKGVAGQSESVSVQEQIDSVLRMVASLSETTTATEDAYGEITKSGSTKDGTFLEASTASENIAALVVMWAGFVETSTATDALAVSQRHASSLLEQVTASESSTTAARVNASLSETLLCIDIIDRSTTAGEIVTSTAALYRAWWNRTYLGGSLWGRHPGKGK